MKIVPAQSSQIEEIVGMSVRAFETDTRVGGKEGDYPPDYDSVPWYSLMTRTRTTP